MNERDALAKTPNNDEAGVEKIYTRAALACGSGNCRVSG
jgi:hypothetical protein